MGEKKNKFQRLKMFGAIVALNIPIVLYGTHKMEQVQVRDTIESEKDVDNSLLDDSAMTVIATVEYKDKDSMRYFYIHPNDVNLLNQLEDNQIENISYQYNEENEFDNLPKLSDYATDILLYEGGYYTDYDEIENQKEIIAWNGLRYLIYNDIKPEKLKEELENFRFEKAVNLYNDKELIGTTRKLSTDVLPIIAAYGERVIKDTNIVKREYNRNVNLLDSTKKKNFYHRYSALYDFYQEVENDQNREILCNTFYERLQNDFIDADPDTIEPYKYSVMDIVIKMDQAVVEKQAKGLLSVEEKTYLNEHYPMKKVNTLIDQIKNMTTEQDFLSNSELESNSNKNSKKEIPLEKRLGGVK